MLILQIVKRTVSDYLQNQERSEFDLWFDFWLFRKYRFREEMASDREATMALSELERIIRDHMEVRSQRPQRLKLPY